MASATSLPIRGYPYVLITSSNRIDGVTISTLSILRTCRCISGYSRPVLLNTAFTSGKTDLTRWRRTVLSFPPEKLTTTLPFQWLYHSMIRAWLIWIFRSSGNALSSSNRLASCTTSAILFHPIPLIDRINFFLIKTVGEMTAI